jgi:hypothetical protein
MWRVEVKAVMARRGVTLSLHVMWQAFPCGLGTPVCVSPSHLQSRTDEIGQALLRNTLLTAPDALRRKRTGSVATGGGPG